MKIRRSPKGFTLIELLVVISIIAVLASLAVPAVTGAMTRGQLIQTVNNARQVHLAAFTMANDGVATSDPNLGWPGDLAASTTGTTTVSSQTEYVKLLVSYDYLKAADLKVFAAPGIVAFTGTDVSSFDSTKNSAFNIYKVTENGNSTDLFLATRNYDAAGTAIITGTTPYGDKGFVICRKAGDAAYYKKAQAPNTNYFLFTGTATKL